MAGQIELNELKKTMEEMSQKMDKMLTLVRGMVNLFTSVIPNTNDDVGDPGADKLCSKVKLSKMFKDLVEIHDARAHSKEILDPCRKPVPTCILSREKYIRSIPKAKGFVPLIANGYTVAKQVKLLLDAPQAPP
ncbi:hypothetical protein RHMOL_Rhmol01G0157900 [Rhododendron molle]|uniref:Uncharacterized protein n=1 Tax=Rhododendron molle TaxID=49168 RepID=A0ACC0Q3H2_RHOML|nr:hypothetical protein RHMOL_Rhmol01G0157900 [Rhododendron molle]